jgi:integrase
MWVIPAARMKAEKEHRVPLSAEAVALLRKLPRLAKGQAGAELLFPSSKGTPLSDMTLAACIKRLNEKHEAEHAVKRWIDPRTGNEATPHGTARSTFRDWVAERTHFPGDMAEMALAHTLSSAVEAAYRRGDMVEKRRKMMEAWATFCRAPRVARSNVVAMATAGR